MCLNPRYIVNKHYCGTLKNNYEAPELTDARKKYVQIGCGYCVECKKQIRRDWTIRCEQEHKWNKLETSAWTLSFSEEALDRLEKETGEKNANIIARKAVTQWRKRIWKAWKRKEINVKNIKHMWVSEIGGHNTERLHFHGLIWADAKTQRWFKQDWEKYYGNCQKGQWLGHKTVVYVVKYLTKADMEHPGYKSIALVSPGLGKGYVNNQSMQEHRFRGDKTERCYRNAEGYKMSLPRYYHKKFWNEEERDWMWTNMLDKNVNIIKDKKYDMSDPIQAEEYWTKLMSRSQANYRMGYVTYGKKVAYNSRNGVKSAVAYKYDSEKGNYSKRYKKIRKPKALPWSEENILKTRAIFESITGGTQHSLKGLIDEHNSHKINKVTCTHIDQEEEVAFWEKAPRKMWDPIWNVWYNEDTGEIYGNMDEEFNRLEAQWQANEREYERLNRKEEMDDYILDEIFGY